MERRRGERFASSLPTQSRLLLDGTAVHARACDLSDRGLRLTSRRKLAVGSLLEVDLEVCMPVQLRLGYDLDSLVVDGPPASHFAQLRGIVRRCERRHDRRWTVGLEFAPDIDEFSMHVIETYLDHLRMRDQESTHLT